MSTQIIAPRPLVGQKVLLGAQGPLASFHCGSISEKNGSSQRIQEICAKVQPLIFRLCTCF